MGTHPQALPRFRAVLISWAGRAAGCGALPLGPSVGSLPSRYNRLVCIPASSEPIRHAHRFSSPRLALCQRSHSPRPPGRISPDRHLGPLPEAAGQPLHLRLRRRHPRHGHHDPRPAGGHRRRGVDRPDAEGPRDGFRRLSRSSSTTTAAPTARRTASIAGRSGRPSAGDDLVSQQEVSQLYDPVAGTFLADRFVKGTCPNCKSPDQYGDSCDKCGDALQPRRT